MKTLTRNQIPKVQLHPITVSYIKKGHPWITKDSYTEKFPSDSPFLIGQDKNKKDCCLFIHDYKHPKIKGRIWSLDPSVPFSFKNDLHERLKKSLLKRTARDYDRENIYLCFGEGDLLPGLHILLLKNILFVQFYSFFWHSHKEILEENLTFLMSKCFPKIDNLNIFFQIRKSGDELAKSHQYPDDLILREHEINYLIKFKQGQDIGIYTDMSSIREEIIPFMKNAQSCLNLFSYTGAFSLLALKLGSKKVVSVDLSKKYANWLEKNIKLNIGLPKENHLMLVSPVIKSLLEFSEKKEFFDFIICDPPSSSNDGKSKTTAFKNYKKILPLIMNILEKNGMAFLCLNTHSISRKKFLKSIEDTLIDNKFSYKILKNFSLKDDCAILNFHEEGDYLKGILLQKK